MVECPDPNCRESLLKSFNSACGEFKTQLNKKVSINIMCWTFVAFLTAIGIVAGISYEAYSRSQDGKQKQINNVRNEVRECEEVTKELDKNVAVMQSDIEHIKEQLEKQGYRQEKILEILNELKAKMRDQ